MEIIFTSDLDQVTKLILELRDRNSLLYNWSNEPWKYLTPTAWELRGAVRYVRLPDYLVIMVTGRLPAKFGNQWWPVTTWDQNSGNQW